MERIKKALIGGIMMLSYISISILGFIILVGLYIVPYLDNL